MPQTKAWMKFLCGSRHRPGAASLRCYVGSIQTARRIVLENKLTTKASQQCEVYKLTPPGPALLFCSGLFEWGVVVKEGVLFRGHIPPVGRARADWHNADTPLLTLQYRCWPLGALPTKQTGNGHWTHHNHHCFTQVNVKPSLCVITVINLTRIS